VKSTRGSRPEDGGGGGHEDGPDALEGAADDGQLEGEGGLAADPVDVVHQEDGVVDHDAAHHDDADVRLAGERRPT
jgi:hypothetical protein